MAAVESVIRRLFEGRARRWSIITVNALLALGLGIPAADEYFEQRQREADLSAQLEQAEEQLQRAAELRTRVTEVALQLQQMEKRSLFDSNEQQYRQALVQSVRKSGCQLRKLTLEEPTTHGWNLEDDPLSQPSRRGKGKKDETSAYRLRTQKVSLSISGDLKDVRALLNEMQANDKLMHVTQLSIRPNGRNRTNVAVELKYQLFGLEKATTPFPSA